MGEQDILVRIKEAVLSFDEHARVILFGSRARKTSNKESDWDLLILTSFSIDEKKKRQLRDLLFSVELETDQAISSIIHSRQNWERLEITPLYQAIKRDGVRI